MILLKLILLWLGRRRHPELFDSEAALRSVLDVLDGARAREDRGDG